MIRHVVLFAWTDEATSEQKQRVADELRALPPQMSGLRAYHVGHDAGLVDGNADFAVVADFDDVASFLAYREHPAHRAVINDSIAPITRQRSAVQYEI
jgi:Stress responsive A/B Barrel Domain